MATISSNVNVRLHPAQNQHELELYFHVNSNNFIFDFTVHETIRNIQDLANRFHLFAAEIQSSNLALNPDYDTENSIVRINDFNVNNMMISSFIEYQVEDDDSLGYIVFCHQMYGYHTSTIISDFKLPITEENKHTLVQEFNNIANTLLNVQHNLNHNIPPTVHAYAGFGHPNYLLSNAMDTSEVNSRNNSPMTSDHMDLSQLNSGIYSPSNNIGINSPITNIGNSPPPLERQVASVGLQYREAPSTRVLNFHDE